MGIKIIKQHDISDCGATCLAMISAYYGLKYPLSKYRELTKTDKAGTNLYGLESGANALGFSADALSGTPDDLINSIHNNEITFPFVAHIVSEDDLLHFIVVYKYRNGKFTIGDPAKGKLKLNQDDFFKMWTGYIVTFTPTDKLKKGNYSKGEFTKFLKLLKGQYHKLFFVLLLSICITVTSIAGAFIFEIVIDNFTTGITQETDIAESNNEPHDGETKIEIALETILTKLDSELNATEFNLIFLFIIALYSFQAIVQTARGYLIVLVSKHMDTSLLLTYYQHIVGLPISSLTLRQTGDYLARFSDAASIRQAISDASVTLMLDSVMVIVCGIILYKKSSLLFLISLLMIAIYTVVVICYRKPIEKTNRRVMENNAAVESYLKESIDGLETVKAACAENEIKRKMFSKFKKFINSLVNNSMISVSQDVIVDTVELVGRVCILWIGFSLVITNHLTVGTLITFYVLLSYFTQPIKNVVELQPTIQKAFVAAERLNDILNLELEKQNTESLPSIESIEIKDVTFRYGYRPAVLKNISMKLHKGEKIAIVGESGCGKSTLVKLLLGFYFPESGKISVNSKDLTEESLTALRSCSAYVGQNVFFFSDTIKNNLTLETSDVTDEEIIHVCKLCGIDDFIQSLPLGYNTPLNEGGSELSGGQKQRLALARALLKKPQLLVLDEATSSLDSISENIVKNTVFHEYRDLTCIIIAHRFSTIQNCDRILVMQDGIFTEEGSHTNLLNSKNKYYRMWEAQ